MGILKIDIAKFIEEWKQNILLVVVLAILSVILVFLFGRTATLWHEHNKVQDKMLAVRESYNRFIIGNKQIPDQNDINTYEDYAKKLSDLYSSIYRSMKTTREVDTDKSPLEFKQYLNMVQQEIQNKAQQQNIIIPLDIGFKEFMGDKIPAEDSIATLCLQLDLTTFLLNSCFEAKVERVDSIIKMPPLKKSPHAKELPFKLTFKSEMQGIVELLDTLQSQKNLFIVDELNITAIPQTEFRDKNNMGYLLEVSMDISYIELK